MKLKIPPKFIEFTFQNIKCSVNVDQIVSVTLNRDSKILLVNFVSKDPWTFENDTVEEAETNYNNIMDGLNRVKK